MKFKYLLTLPILSMLLLSNFFGNIANAELTSYTSYERGQVLYKNDWNNFKKARDGDFIGPEWQLEEGNYPQIINNEYYDFSNNPKLMMGQTDDMGVIYSLVYEHKNNNGTILSFGKYCTPACDFYVHDGQLRLANRNGTVLQQTGYVPSGKHVITFTAEGTREVVFGNMKIRVFIDQIKVFDYDTNYHPSYDKDVHLNHTKNTSAGGGVADKFYEITKYTLQGYTDYLPGAKPLISDTSLKELINFIANNNNVDQITSIPQSPPSDKVKLSVNKNLIDSANGDIIINPPGSICDYSCSGIALPYDPADNTKVSITAIPNDNSLFTGWSGDSDCTDGDNLITMNKDVACTANFEPKSTLRVDISGSGSITANALEDTATCSSISGCAGIIQDYKKNTKINLTATADQDYIFQGWTGEKCLIDNEPTGTLSSEITITMSQDITCTAKFEPLTNKNYLLKINLEGSGKGIVINHFDGTICNRDQCSGKFPGNKWIQLEAQADSGSNSEFAGWSGDCEGEGTCRILMNGPKTINANFISPITVTFLPSSNESIDFSENGNVDCNERGGGYDKSNPNEKWVSVAENKKNKIIKAEINPTELSKYVTFKSDDKNIAIVKPENTKENPQILELSGKSEGETTIKAFNGTKELDSINVSVYKTKKIRTSINFVELSGTSRTCGSPLSYLKSQEMGEENYVNSLTQKINNIWEQGGISLTAISTNNFTGSNSIKADDNNNCILEDSELVSIINIISKNDEKHDKEQMPLGAHVIFVKNYKYPIATTTNRNYIFLMGEEDTLTLSPLIAKPSSFVIAHELGHVLNINHSNNDTKLMFDPYNENAGRNYACTLDKQEWETSRLSNLLFDKN